jgi:hypothetical protein
MHPLLERLQPLLASEAVEDITRLLEVWEPRDDVWAECVEGRLYAPSTSEAQRTRLRAVRSAHRAAMAERRAAPPRVDPAPSRQTEAETVTASALGALPEFDVHLTEAAARLASLPSNWEEPARALVALVRRGQAHERERLEKRVPSVLGPSQPSVSATFVRLGPVADDAELTAVQALAPVSLGASVLSFYRTIGGLVGDLGGSGLELHVPPPRTLLAAHASSRPAQQLVSLSLLDVARWCWGNDRPELARGVLPAAVEQAARATPCIGWVSDGSAEQHGYLVQRPDALFQLHVWHQDDDFGAPAVASPGATDLWTMLHDVLRQMDPSGPTAPVEYLSELVVPLNSSRR